MLVTTKTFDDTIRLLEKEIKALKTKVAALEKLSPRVEKLEKLPSQVAKLEKLPAQVSKLETTPRLWPLQDYTKVI